MGKKEQNCKEIFYLRKKLTKINGFEWKKKQKTKSKKKNGEKSKFLILTTYVERKSLYAQQFRKIFKPLFRIRDFFLLREKETSFFFFFGFLREILMRIISETLELWVRENLWLTLSLLFKISSIEHAILFFTMSKTNLKI